MVRQLYDGMAARITGSGTVLEVFAVTNGVKQGCALVPTIFTLMFSAMPTDAYRDIQRSMDLFAVSDSFDLAITDKMVVRHQPPPDAAYNVPQINVNSAQLQAVRNLTYLGSSASCNAKIDDEVARRISNASQAFSCLQNTVWNRHDLHLNTRLKMYKAVILSTLLNGEQTWTVCKK
nr:unnamed protein product [Spirometra erinaceieuropaei]